MGRVIGLDISDGRNYDPARSADLTPPLTMGAVYETLITLSADDLVNVKPALATSWSLVKDGTGWRFALRPGVKFWNGDAMTAEDVKFSLDRLMKSRTSRRPMKRILVVEDEPSIALGLEIDLRTEGYHPVLVADGIEAARRAREEAFDLILLDAMLPGKDGFEVCRELRHAGVATPIILLTAKTHDAEKIIGLELGADDYVTKPFNPMELRARIKAVLRRSPSGTPEVYQFGDAEVDFARCEFRRAGQTVEVTPTEFKLLTLFVRSRGRTLSRDHILKG